MVGKKALLMVDLQNDFCRNGALSVPDGDAVIPTANQLQNHFDLIITSIDWHPQDHTSFAINHPGFAVGDIITLNGFQQVLWPAHCVQDTPGAQFHPDLKTDKIAKTFQKGVDKNIDSYSAFYDNAHQRSTGLDAFLKSEAITDLYILGLATDYCVKYSSLDAAKLGLNVFVIEDACRGVELNPGDIVGAFEEMRQAGVQIILSENIK